MKNYKEFEKKVIGDSDIATLTVRSALNLYNLSFGQDGLYSAYIVDETCIIPEHYKLVIECDYWLKIYDDEKLTFYDKGKKFKVYRAGEFGCIIQKINN